MPNNPHYPISKVSLEIISKSWDIFRVNHLGSLLLPYVSVGEQQFMYENAI
jgi:hypothetical protein